MMTIGTCIHGVTGPCIWCGHVPVVNLPFCPITITTTDVSIGTGESLEDRIRRAFQECTHDEYDIARIVDKCKETSCQ